MGKVEFTYSFDPFLYRTNNREAAGYYYPAADYEALEAKLTAAAERERVLVECLKYIEKELRYIPDNIPHSGQEINIFHFPYNIPLHFLNLANKISAALAQVKGEK